MEEQKLDNNTNILDQLTLTVPNENGTDWKRRTLELEEQLCTLRERVNSQTTKIRDAVSKRVNDAEERAEDAETKYQAILKRVSQFEERTIIAEGKVTRCYGRNQHLEDIIEQKESIIRQLRETIAEEQSKHDADVKLFESKVTQVREWVRQVVGELQKENAALKQEMAAKDNLIQSLQEASKPATASTGKATKDHSRRPRGRSKSAVSIRKLPLVQVNSENASNNSPPAVPIRKASLGVIKRSNSVTTRTVSKDTTNLNTLEEDLSSRIYDVLENTNEDERTIENNNNKLPRSPMVVSEASTTVSDTSQHSNKELQVDPVTKSKLYTELKKGDSLQKSNSPSGSPRITMRERLKLLTGNTSEESRQSINNGDNKTTFDGKNNETTGLINTLEMYSEDGPAEIGMEHKVILKVTSPTNEVASKPGETDELGYTKLFYGENEKSTDDVKDNGYLPPGYVLSPNKMDSDSSGCSSLEHTPPMMASWLHDSKSNNPLLNGVISSEEWKRSSDLDTIQDTQNGFSGNFDQTQSCPVYAQLEGRASEIQNRPCTGDSTDSSENEGDTSTEGEPANTGRMKNVSMGDRLLRRGSSRRKVLKTCAQYTTQNLKSESQQKTGYLSKLGGRVKNWKRRWFVLSENKLSYYKNENEVTKKPLGQIPLDGFCGITRTEGSMSFQIDTAKRKYYLTGETVEDINDWLKALQNVLQKFMASPLLAQVNEKAVMKGWITKVKLGKSKSCYCILRGKYLCYYKSEHDQAPFNLLNMKDVRIQKICTADSEDDLDCDDEANTKRSNRYTLRLYNEKEPNTSSIYLLIDTKLEHMAWLYHLTMASGHIDKNGTEFEQTIVKLKEEDNPESSLWNSDIMTYTKEPLLNPLTTLPSVELENKALQLFKSIQLFSNAECVPGPAIDYHVVYAQNALQMCMAHSELREEIYCQLIKQTAKQVYRLSDSADALQRFLAPHSEWFMNADKSYSVASDATIDLRPTKEYVYEQCWQMLILCCTLFIPRGQILWFLKAHLQRYSAKVNVIGKYAKYCRHCLDRTIQNGEREAGPSRMEVIDVLLNVPFEKKFPLKIPVHFINRTSEEFGFDGATTVQEFIDSINAEVGLRSTDQSGYALYADNPVGPIQHCLQTSVKVCDVIAKWEKAMQNLHQGRFEPKRVIKFSYKNRLYFKSLEKKETPRERYFLVYQTFHDILHGKFPVSKDRCIQMTALMAQMEFGDRVAHDNQSDEKILMIIDRFYPIKHKEPLTSEQRRQLKNRFLDSWQSLIGKTRQESIMLYLCMAKSWFAFGAKLFKAKQRRIVSKKRDSGSEITEDIWLAVQEDCISILDTQKMNPVFKYKYRSVVTFGGWKEDFMLVVNKTQKAPGGQSELGTERLLFAMPRGKILEITLLIASYINAIVRQQGLTFDVACKENAAAAENNMKVWDMESVEWPMVPGSGLI